jgi:arabinose-5-phosphate isomerase
LGRQLVTVEQAALFSRGRHLPCAGENLTVGDALDQAEANAELRHGCILLVNEQGQLSGLLTDGDLRRILKKFGTAALGRPVKEVMTKNPRVVKPQTLAGEAMAIFHQGRIDEIPVVDDDHRPVGLIDVQDVVTLKIMQ